jgi:hypothetical protein
VRVIQERRSGPSWPRAIRGTRSVGQGYIQAGKWSSEIGNAGSRRCHPNRKATRRRALAQVRRGPRSRRPPACIETREPRGPVATGGRKAADRWEKAMSHKAHMRGGGESNGGVVPAKQLNQSGGPPAEAVEGRPPTKENMDQQNLGRTPSRENRPNELDRVREAMCASTPNIQGRTRVRQSRQHGSVRGAAVNRCPYRDRRASTPTAQAGHRYWRDQCWQVYGARPQATVAGSKIRPPHSR